MSLPWWLSGKEFTCNVGDVGSIPGLGGSLEKGTASSGAFQMVLVIKNLPANARDARDGGSTPGLGSSPGEGSCSPLQYSCLGSPMDRGSWWATAHGVAKSQTQLSD